MKKLLIIFTVLALASCKVNEEKELKNSSPDDKVKITLKGKKTTMADPWSCELNVKAYDLKEGALKFEIYANDLNDETVKFEWQDNNTCLITFTQSDDEKRVFKLIADKNDVQLAEISN